MLILGTESSCDETSASVAEFDCNKRILLSNVVASQIETHKLYGGVVPEIASRAHIEAISGVTYAALSEAGASLDDVELVAVTRTPGLIGPLLVGVNFAKSLAYANGIPLVGVDHIKGHVAANYFRYPELEPPFFAIVASGGHTSLIDVKDYTVFEEVGSTRDDAIGEAFDKVARVMGLPYPGGAQMDALASEEYNVGIKFPSAAVQGENLDFSFSGLKTAVVNYIHNAGQKGEEYSMIEVAKAFTEAVTSSVVKKLGLALERYSYDKLVLAGGVAANSHLRNAISGFCKNHGAALFMPDISLCGDNGAMIAAQGYYEYLAGARDGVFLNAEA